LEKIPKKSDKKGKSHGDTNDFNDYDEFLSSKKWMKLKKIVVYHDTTLVYGIECFYWKKKEHVLTSAGYHCGSSYPLGAKHDEIKLGK